MIQVKDLYKTYDHIEALKGVSFAVEPGEIVGLLGPNGAGKSTTIKILTGYLHPDAGSVEIDGLDVLTHPQAVQSRIGYLSENTPLYPNLSVQAYLKLMADMRAIPTHAQPALLSEAIYATGLVEHRARPIAQLSKGLRQRVGLAQAILHKPKLLILDEPTVGLDPTQIVEIRHLIKRLAQHSTILFSSHILSEVEAVCDRVVIVINGEIKADAHLNELASSTDAVLVMQEDRPDIAEKLGKLAAVSGVETFHTPEGYAAYRVRTDEDMMARLFALARAEEWAVRELRRDVLTLEAVFNKLASVA